MTATTTDLKTTTKNHPLKEIQDTSSTFDQIQKENAIFSYFSSAKDLQPGDHIYIWKCAYMYQRHAVVLSVDKDNDNEEIITIVEFYQDQSLISLTSLENFAENNQVRKVQYSATWLNRCFGRSGTVTSQCRDPTSLILARLQYVIDNPHVLPEFHALSSNDECICVWILTGIYCTLQVCSQLYVFSASQMKSAVVTSSVVAHMSVSVPMTGMWGYLGYTTTVPLTTAQPLIIPMLVGYGLISIIPLEMLRRYKKKWRCLEEELDRDFWNFVGEDVLERYFLECIKHKQVIKEFFDGDIDWKIEDFEQQQVII